MIDHCTYLFIYLSIYPSSYLPPGHAAGAGGGEVHPGSDRASDGNHNNLVPAHSFARAHARTNERNEADFPVGKSKGIPYTIYPFNYLIN